MDQPREARGRRKNSRRRFTIVTVITLAVLVAGGATAYAMSSSGNSGYRMGTVVRASIANSQDLVGTVEPVNDVSASFQVAGQVATVTATVGQQVTAGQSLGTLDTTSLSESLSSAQSSLASDEAQLTEDEDSEAASTTTTTTTTTPTTTGSGSGPSSGGSGKPGGTGQIGQDQATLVADQAKASAEQQQEAADLAQAETTCESTSSSSSTTTSNSPGSTPPSSTTTTTTPATKPTTKPTTTTPTTTTTTPTTGVNACATALEQVSGDQQAVSTDQATVATDESALAKALAAEQSAASSSGTASSTPTTTPTKASTGTTDFSAASSAGSSQSERSGDSSPGDSAATIASDEATIDTAEANVVDAQQSLSDAQLTSPINGTIASVGLGVGDTVSADSSTATIVIIGTQSFEADATLSSTQVSAVKVGDAAEVSVDGTDKSIAGSVSQVGPVQGSDGTYSYPVVVALPPSATGLFTGSSANISITTSQAKDVLAVPTSAVNTEGTRSFVVEISAGTPVDKTVKVGLVGYTFTQLTSGVKQGDRVVLASYSEAVPTSSATTLGGFGGGGFGGGGRFNIGSAGGGRFTPGGGATTFGG